MLNSNNENLFVEGFIDQLLNALVPKLVIEYDAAVRCFHKIPFNNF